MPEEAPSNIRCLGVQPGPAWPVFGHRRGLSETESATDAPCSDQTTSLPSPPPVTGIEKMVAALTEKGVKFERFSEHV